LLEWLVLVSALIATVPVRVSLRVDISRESTFQVLLHVYGFRMQFNGLIDKRGEISVHREGGTGELRVPLRGALSLGKHLLKNAQFVHTEAECAVGTGDACLTALATAALSVALRALGAGFGLRVKVKPEFNRTFFALKARCILCFRGGDIILAGIKAFSGPRPMKRKAGSANGTASH